MWHLKESRTGFYVCFDLFDGYRVTANKQKAHSFNHIFEARATAVALCREAKSRNKKLLLIIENSRRIRLRQFRRKFK